MKDPAREEETRLLLHAFVDGELDAASSLALERRLAEDRDLAAERDAIVALRQRLRADVPRPAASAGLRALMAAQAGSDTVLARPSSVPMRRAPWGRAPGAWRLALAACLVGALFGAGLTGALMRPQATAPAMAEVVADHLRAVMAPQPFDVASSDQHTVKPWFTGRLSFAPEVLDLAPDGFLLVGGRVDVVGGLPAASLVFRHGRHLISLISQPAGPASASSPDAAPSRGFAVREWVGGGLRYWAVSDVAADELAAFEAAFRAKARP